MKKQFITIMAALCLSVGAVAQIPNSGFETWTSMGTYDNPDGWGTMNNTTALASVYTCTKATPGSPGSYYMKLTSKTVASTVVNGIAVSGKLDSMTMQPRSGFAFSQRPANFTGKWQHMIYGTSQGSVVATLTRWDVGMNMRMPVATASVTLSGMAMSWANFTLPFTYVDGNFPDSCIIVLKASGANPTDQDYLWVDNLAFTGSVAGVETHAALLSGMNVYPTPAKEHVTLEFDLKSAKDISVTLYDLSGKMVLAREISVAAGNNQYKLDVSALSKGVYIVKATAGSDTETRKIIIE